MQSTNKQTCGTFPGGCVHQCAGCDLVRPKCPDAVRETCPFYRKNAHNSVNGDCSGC